MKKHIGKAELERVNQLNSLIRDLGKEAIKKGFTEENLEEMMEETKIQTHKKIYG